MSREIFAGITIADLTFLGVVLLVGLVLAGSIIIVVKRLKRRFRSKSRTSLGAQILDDLEEVLALLVLIIALFLGLVALPPVKPFAAQLQTGSTVVSIALVVYVSIRVQGHALVWYGRRAGRRRTAQAKVLQSMAPMARRIASIVIFALGSLLVLDQLGISIAPLVAGLGIGGLAVALALQGTLTNFFAGLNVMTDGSIRVGDFVELDGGLMGIVDQIGWRTTRLRMLANNMVIIPNSRLADSVATNYNYPEDQMSVYVQVGVGYYSDLDHVERVTVEVAREVTEETEGAIPLSDYEPSVWYTEFGDSNINFWVVLRSQGFLESWLLKHNFIKALFRRYNELGIEISFPNSNVFFRDGPAGPSLAEMPVTATGNAAALKSPRARPRGRAPARIPGEVGQGESAPDLPDVPG